LDERVDQGSIYHADIYFWGIYIGIKRLKQATHNTLKETWKYKVGFDPSCWLTRGLELQLCYKRPIHVLSITFWQRRRAITPRACWITILGRKKTADMSMELENNISTYWKEIAEQSRQRRNSIGLFSLLCCLCI
jgi:hypothetical protein